MYVYIYQHRGSSMQEPGCRDSRIDGGLHQQFEVAQRSCIYICHYMSTLALSQMPEASHLLCRKPNAGIQALVLCSLRALHIFSIFMYSCICQSMIWSFSYNDTLQCLIVFTEPTNLDLCTYICILNCCHLRRYFEPRHCHI